MELEKSLMSISATHRSTSLALLGVALIAIGVLYNVATIHLGIFVLLVLAALRGYALLELHALARCRVEVSYSGNVEGEHLEVVFRIVNRSVVPIVFVELTLCYSPHLKLVEGTRAALTIIPPKGWTSYRAVFVARIGRHTIGPLKAVVRDPLGLFRSVEIEIGRPIEVEILPRISEVVIRKLLIATRTTGITRAREPGVGIEFLSVREYRPGDEIRRIDWKHFASKRRLVVKEMEREAFQSVVFLIDATPPMFFGSYGSTPFEHSARVVASIANYLSRRGDLMMAIVFHDNGVSSSGKPARGRIGYTKVIKTLASTPYPDTTRFKDIPELDEDRIIAINTALSRLIELLPRERNLVFLFTCFGGQRYLQHLASICEKLRSLGNVVYAVIPIVVAYEAKGLSPWAQAVFRITTFERMKKELEFAKALRKYGIKTIAVGPQHIPNIIVKIIEHTKA